MGYKLLVKQGASLVGLKLEMRVVFKTAHAIWLQYSEEMVVTEGTGGEHSPGSLHPFGYAVDLRTRYFDYPTASKVRDELQARLGDNYDVINHAGSHIHVEYDPK